MTNYSDSRLSVCPDFVASCRHSLCHVCLKSRSSHPSDDDTEYWAQWTVFHTLTELALPVADEVELTRLCDEIPRAENKRVHRELSR